MTTWQRAHVRNRLAERRRHGPYGNFGYAIFEVMVALLVLVLILLTAGIILFNAGSTVELAIEQVAAANLAKGQLACISAQDLPDVNTCVDQNPLTSPPSCTVASDATCPASAWLTKPGVVVEGGTDYTVKQLTQWTYGAGNGPADVDCLNAIAEVDWRSPSGVNQTRHEAKLTHCGKMPVLAETPPNANLSFTGWNDTLGAYEDASPGNTGGPQTFTLTYVPPAFNSSFPTYLSISDVQIVDPTGGSAATFFEDHANNSSLTDTCTNAYVSPVPSPWSCEMQIEFHPPATATPGQTVTARLEFVTNGVAVGGSSPPNVTLTGYVSPDLIVVP